MKIIDLTRTLEDGQPGVEFESRYTVEDRGWNARTLHLYSHTGTHMDAPFHFGVSDETIEEISLDRLLVRGHVFEIDVTSDSQQLTIEDLGPSREEVLPGEAVILKTNWSQHFDDFLKFRDGLPGISEELARWFVEKKVGVLGVEPPSVADVNDIEEVTLIHKVLLGGGVIIVEGLVNLDQIGDQPFHFGAMPLKIGDGDGTPCRAFAIVGLSCS